MAREKLDKQKMVAALKKQRRAMHHGSEQEFAFYLGAASHLMPERSEEPLFGFIVRRLWQPHDGCVPPCWLQVLPDLYSDFCERHAWLLAGSDVKGSPAAGLQSLASLLCVLRKRQRDLEGQGEAQ